MAVIVADSENKYIGTAENDSAVATTNDETFDLKGGTDTIDFTGTKGYSGKNTVVVGENEDLSITLGNDEYSCYKDGDDIKIITYSPVRYYVTAKIEAVEGDTPSLNGDPIHSSYITTVGTEKRVTFYIGNAYTNDYNDIGMEYYSYVWRNEFGADGKDEPESPHTYILLPNQAFLDDSYVVSNTKFSDFKVIKEYYSSGDALGGGVFAEDVTDEYVSKITNVNSYNQNWSYGESSIESDINLKDFAKEDIGSDVTITNDGSKISEKTFSVGYDEGETSYTGSWLGESIYALRGQKDGDINDTIDLKTGNDVVTYGLYYNYHYRDYYPYYQYASVEDYNYIGNDVITYNENENLEIVFRGVGAGQIEYKNDNDDIILTVYDVQKDKSGASDSSGAIYNVIPDRSKEILGTVRIVNGAKENFGNGTIKFTSTAYYGSDYDITKNNFIIGNRYSAEDQVLQGSFRDEKFTVGWGDDTVNTNGGNDTVYIRRPGNNTINLTKGEGSKDTIIVSDSDDYTQDTRDFKGNSFNSVAENVTVINNSDEYDTLELKTSFSSSSSGRIEFFRKDGNTDDLEIIVRSSSNSASGIDSRYTVIDYFKNESKIAIVSPYEDTTFSYDSVNDKFVGHDEYHNTDTDFEIKTLITGAGEISATNASEGIIATGKSTLSTGDGHDVIYTSSASDTIVVNGAGEKHIRIDGNSGKDIIQITTDTKVIDAGDGNDNISGQKISVTNIYGGDGNDKIEVNGGENVIYGGRGNDKIVISSTDPNVREHARVVFRTGDGHDVLKTINADVDLVFENYSSEDLVREKYGDDYIIRYGEDSVRIEGFFALSDDDRYGYKTVTTDNNGSYLMYWGTTTVTSASDSWTEADASTAEATTNLTGTSGSDNIQLGDNVVANPLIYLDYDGTTVTRGQEVTRAGYGGFAFNYPFSYGKDGDDLIITHQGSEYDPSAQYSKETSGSVRIKDYFKENYSNIKMRFEGYYNPEYYLPEVIQKCATFDVKGSQTKPNNLVGSDYSEIFYGGEKDDKISTGGGDDVINLAKGKDIVTIDGSGDKTINFNTNSGTKTITGAQNATTVNLNNEDYSNEEIAYTKSGRDMVLHFFNKNTLKMDDIVISNYYKADGDIDSSVSERIYVNGTTIEDFGKMVAGKKAKSVAGEVATLIGTGKVDTITSNNGGDVVYAGAGNDKIYVNNTSTVGRDVSVYAGKGKDTIYIKNAKFESGSGHVNLYFKEGEGNKTVVLSEKLTNTSQHLHFYIEPVSNGVYQDSLTYRKSGNDLLIDAKYLDNVTGKTKSKMTITVKNYFTYGQDIANYISYKYRNSSSFSQATLLQYDYINITGKKNVFEGTNYRDRITGTAKADKITTGNAYDVITPGKGNDTITINGSGQKYITINHGDGTDSIKFADGATGTATLRFESPTTDDFISYDRKGDDLIINRTYDNGSKFVTEQTKVIDGYKSGSPTDKISYSSSTTIYNKIGGLSNKDNTANITSSTVTLNGVETADTSKKLYVGGSKKDTVTSSASYTAILTGAGNDDVTITGGGYTKVMTGAGNDTVSISGSDYGITVYAGAGNDTIDVNSAYSTVFGDAGNDIINVTTGSHSIYAGAGKDTITMSGNAYGTVNLEAGNNTITLSNRNTAADWNYTTVYSGTGDDTFIFESGAGNTYLRFYDYNGFDGNDTVRFNAIPTGNVYMEFYNNDKLLYSKKGDNLVISETVTKDKKTKTEAVTIEDYFKEGKESLEDKLYIYRYSNDPIADCINSNGLSISGVANKALKRTDFTGTKYADNMIGTAKVDYALTGDGDDNINLGKGNDIVEINGSGTKNITIAHGDGTDSIIFTSEATGVANLVIDKQDVYGYEATTAGVDVTRYYTDSKGNIQSEITRITKTNEQSVTINGSDMTVEKANVVAGTKNKDIVTLSGADSAAITGAGDDEITVTNGDATIIAGKGNDKITLSTTGNVVYNHVMGDGNDVISVGTNKPAQLTINIESSAKYTGSDYLKNYGLYGFEKDGNNLIMRVPSVKNKYETITFEDYFTDKKPDSVLLNYHVRENYNIDNYSLDEILSCGSGWADSEYDPTTKTTTFTGSDVFYQNKYSYAGKGKAVYNGSSNYDEYLVTLNKNSELLINDRGSDYDRITFNANYKNLRAFFNVSSSGQVLVSDNQNSDNFIILDKSGMTTKNIQNVLSGAGKGYVNINNFFADGDGEVFNAGDGYIEYLIYPENYKKYLADEYDERMHTYVISQESWINSVTAEVSGWLTDNGFNSTFDVLENGSQKQIDAMVKVYAGVAPEIVSTLS